MIIFAQMKEIITIKRRERDTLLFRVMEPYPLRINRNRLDTLYAMTQPDTLAELIYFFHPDHLGSASWITDLSGQPVQHLQYKPFGGDYIDQQDPNTDYSERFRFTGKERDAETGYDYFGARYYSSSLGIWLSVDPMSDKYPSLSPYVYCADNPMRLVDPKGKMLDGYEGSNGQYKWFDKHTEQSFKDNNVIWTKVTDNKSDWREATTIRNANIEGLVILGFDREVVEKDVRLYDGNDPLFTKESKLNNANNYITDWMSAPNSGGEEASQSPEIASTGYALKYYPTKNSGFNSLGIVKTNKIGHAIEGFLEWLERKKHGNIADTDPIYDMHYYNALGLLKMNKQDNSSVRVSPPSIYSNYHKSGGMKLP